MYLKTKVQTVKNSKGNLRGNQAFTGFRVEPRNIFVKPVQQNKGRTKIDTFSMSSAQNKKLQCSSVPRFPECG